MIDSGKYSLLGVLVNAIDYESTIEKVITAAKNRKPLTVSALAVHGVMTGVLDPEQRYRLNKIDLIVPDGQPVRWALNLLYKANLADRVYGPDLTLKICERAAAEKLPVYFYGSHSEILEQLCKRLQQRFPGLIIAGFQPSLFRQLTEAEQLNIANKIKCSGAAIIFVGLGCPRQEVWLYEHRELLPFPMIAVGAAFNFHAGTIPQAPAMLQRVGLEWAFRFVQEPRRLWRRYMFLNPLYLVLLLVQLSCVDCFDTLGSLPRPLRYG